MNINIKNRKYEKELIYTYNITFAKHKRISAIYYSYCSMKG